jgi:hypothetical protein
MRSTRSCVHGCGGLFSRRGRRLPAPRGGPDCLGALLRPARPGARRRRQARRRGGSSGSRTRVAYVLTGEASVDAISRAGLEGLTEFLVEKTALEPGEPAGVDITKDELAFYPLIYWPIDPASAPMPSEAAIARIDAYMRRAAPCCSTPATSSPLASARIRRAAPMASGCSRSSPISTFRRWSRSPRTTS